ncbi:MAG: hypothetical protein Q8K58_06935 [Acidimicrobiales bacterium]|nr:hypothetical protein [Acidimicrobiales bacterium]
MPESVATPPGRLRRNRGSSAARGLPEFKERDDAVTAEADRIEPVVEEAMARQVRNAPELPADHSSPAIPRRMVDASGNEQGQKWLERLAEETASGEVASSFDVVG